MTTIRENAFPPGGLMDGPPLMDVRIGQNVLVTALRIRDTTGHGYGSLQVFATDLEGNHLSTLATVSRGAPDGVVAAVITEALATARDLYCSNMVTIASDHRTEITELAATLADKSAGQGS